jgi:cell division protein FtsL
VDHEFIVRKPVQNRAIVREVDQARQRDLLRSVSWGAVVLVVVLFTAWQHHEGRRLERQAATLQSQRRELLESQRHLKLERASLVSPARIESVARRQLRMKSPTRETSAVLERVTVAPPPSRAVVASR